MSLGEFIRANVSAIVADWEAAVGRETPAARELEGPALRDHVPLLLAHFAELMNARGARTEERERAAADADAHAVERIEQGFTVTDLVRELALLRNSVLRLWRNAHPNVSIEDTELLNEVFDRAIERSVARYVERRGQLLEGFEQIADAAFQVEDLDTFLDRLLRIFVRFAPSIDTATILLREDDRIRAVASIGLEEEVSRRISFRVGEGFAGTIAATSRPMFLQDASNDPLVQSPVIRAAKVRALFGVPLRDRDDVVGIAHIGRREADTIPVAEQRLFAALAQRAASAIIKQSLRRRARQIVAELDAVAEAIPNPVLVGDRQRITFANRPGLELLGVTSANALGDQGDARLEPLEIRDAETAKPIPPDELPYAVAIDRGEAVVRDLLLRHRTTGVDRVVRAHVGPVREEGDIVGAAMVLSDLTDVNAALAQLRAFVDNMPEISWTALPDGSIDFYNRRWYEYTGTTFDEMRGWGWQRAHDPALVDAVTERWKHAVATGTPFEMEFPLRGADGVFRWFLTRSAPLRDAEGHVVRWIGTSTDVDEQRRLRRELHYALEDARRIAEFRERFLGIVSHDLRNPMNAISLAAATLVRAPQLPPPLVGMAEKIARNIGRMSRMVSELLDFTRGRLGGGIPVDPAPMDLTHAVRVVMAEFEQTHPATKVHLSVEGDAHGTWDAERLMQVIGNVVGNAVHYGAEGTPIDVRIDGRDADVVKLSVHNEGEPIPAEMLPHIFEPFRRAREPDTAEGSPAGLGLGLFIACEITRAHRGAIRVRSDATTGTTFTLTLPRNPPPRLRAPEDAPT